MSFTSSNLVSPDKDIIKAKKALLDNVRAIIQYNMSTSTAKDEKTLKEGIEYLKFIEKDLSSKLEMIKQYKELQSVNKTKLTVNNRLMHTATMESLEPIMNDIGKKDEIFFSELLAESRKLYGFLDKALENYKHEESKKESNKKKSNKNSGNGSKSKTQKNNSRPSRAAAAAEANANTPLKHQLKAIVKQTATFINNFVSFYGDEDNLKPGGYGIPNKKNFEYRNKKGTLSNMKIDYQIVSGDGACGIRAFLTGVMYIVSKGKIILPLDPPRIHEFILQIKLIMLDFILFLKQIPANQQLIRNIYSNQNNLTKEQQEAKYILTHEEYATKLLETWYYFTTDELEVLIALFNLGAPQIYQINIFGELMNTYVSKTVKEKNEVPTIKHINLLHNGNHYDFIVNFELPDDLKHNKDGFYYKIIYLPNN